MADLKTQVLPLVPLTTGVILPHMVVTLALETDEARAGVDAAEGTGGHVLLVPKNDGRYASIGTVAKVEDSGRLPSGIDALVVRGIHRAVIGSGVAGTGTATWVEIEPHSDPETYGEGATALAREYRATVEGILEARGASEIAEYLRGIRNPGHMADTSGYSPDLSFEQKVEVLEALDVEVRLAKVLGWARETLAEAALKTKIRTEVSEGMEKTQREFLLRQQMAAIRKELGEDGDDLVETYRGKIDEAGMPEAVATEARKELDRLERTSEQSPEHSYIRNYLDWMVELPWSKASEDNLDLTQARRILDEDHTGLTEVKERIVEHLAVRKLRAERGIEAPVGRGSGAIITLVGPPGVGKTSLGHSVARALGRKFTRISLGGIHDEAEIRGHRRTYIGALPGRIVRALKDAGTSNPVIMLDEIDKVGRDWRGDPASALLEVLDPAQNHTFRDHYLEVDLDLSDVLFIATANVAETILPPLLDRMELIRLDGYTEDEKVAIARDHLLARQLERNALNAAEVDVTSDAVRAIIRDHTREAGVRNLERELGKVLRKIATATAAGTQGRDGAARVTPKEVRTYLGRPKFFFEAAERTSVPGVATGLAVTGAGGDVLFVEASAMEGETGLTLTGQLGDVMKESAQIALSYVRSHAYELGLSDESMRRRFHVHVPAGAVPKDGPSAGLAITTALVSLLTERPVRYTVGMTGEVTLQGKALPIGGVKQKVLAAHRAGLEEVILPARNEGDLEEVPDEVLGEIAVHLVKDVPEVLKFAFQPADEVAETSAA